MQQRNGIVKKHRFVIPVLWLSLALVACGRTDPYYPQFLPTDPYYWAQLANPRGGTTTLSPMGYDYGGGNGTTVTPNEVSQLMNALAAANQMLNAPGAAGIYGNDIGQVLNDISRIRGLGDQGRQEEPFVGSLLDMLAIGRCMDYIRQGPGNSGSAPGQVRKQQATLGRCVEQIKEKIDPLVGPIARNLDERGLQLLEQSALASFRHNSEDGNAQ